MYPAIYYAVLFGLTYKSFEYDGWAGMFGVIVAWGIFNLFILV
jgi:hypothetical protein